MVTSSNSDEETDLKLAAWLRKILPALEKELEEGVTVSRNQNPPHKKLNIELHQEIDIRGPDSNSNIESSKGSVAWLSVLIQDSAVLAVSCTDSQLKSFVKIYEPRRCKDDAKIYWHELKIFPVEQPIEFLSTNIHNRDLFAGASTSNLYIWSFLNKESFVNDSVL